MRVVVVGGEPDKVAPVVGLLGAGETDWQVETAVALDRLVVREGEPIDCVVAVVDGGQQGAEVVGALRSGALGSPIVVIVESDSPEVARALVERGAQDCLLAGSFDSARVCAAVSHAMTRSRSTETVGQLTRYQMVGNVLPVGLLAQDLEGRVVEANDAALRFLGTTYAEVVTHPPSRPAMKVWREDGSQFELSDMPGRQVVQTGEPRTGVIMGVDRPDGDTAWLEVDVFPLPGRLGGKPIGILSCLRDITEQREIEQEVRFHARMFQAAAHPIVVTDAVGQIIYWNDACAQLYGWTAAEALGRDVSELTDFSDTRVAEEITSALAAGRSWMGETWARRRDGSTFPGLVIDTPIFDRSGKLEAVVGVVADLTDLHSAQHQARVLSSIVESSADPIISTDTRGEIVSWNAAATDLLGYAAEEAIGGSVFEILTDELNPRLAWALGELAEGRPVRSIRGAGVRRDRTSVDVEVTASPVFGADGAMVGVSAIVRDLSDLVHLERLAEREAIEREAAEQANRAKTEFISRMSHELRTPLNAVLGFAQLLELEPDNGDPEAVEQILRAGRHLLELINEVLDIAGIESGEMRLSIEPVVVVEVVTSAISLIQPAATARGIAIDTVGLDHPLAVLADGQRMLQVMLNLLSNAVKYNDQDGSVHIDVGRSGDDWIRISVRDTGPGLSPTEVGKIFTPFERLGADRTGIEGTGVGLTLSRGLVERMGGRIGVESTQGDGSTFWVELREAELASPAPRESVAADEASPLPLGRPLVLYIDDNLANVRLVERVLDQRPDVTLISAMQGRLGLDLAREHLPDLILLDVQLPDLDGLAVLAALQADPRTSSIPVAMVSADATGDSSERFVALGARSFLTKPFDLDDLFALVDAHL